MQQRNIHPQHRHAETSFSVLSPFYDTQITTNNLHLDMLSTLMYLNHQAEPSGSSPSSYEVTVKVHS